MISTEVVEVQIQSDGSYVALGSRDWHAILRGSTVLDVWSIVEDENEGTAAGDQHGRAPTGPVWDFYRILRPDGTEGVFALPVCWP